MKVMSESEAKRFFKKKVLPGKYEIVHTGMGGTYDPRLGCFVHKPIFNTTTILMVVENEYVEHGNGD